MKKGIAPRDLEAFLRYNPETGDLTWNRRTKEISPEQPDWRIAVWNTRFAGKIAGCISATGYHSLRIFGEGYKCHHIVWAMHFGEWPEDVMDHIDHDRTNNRIENLRVCSARENALNTCMSKSNTSGVTGVYWFKRAQKWMARIGNNNQRLNLGSYDRFEDAVKARKDAERALGYHPNHGILPAIRKAA